jgi:hypothetical protein
MHSPSICRAAAHCSFSPNLGDTQEWVLREDFTALHAPTEAGNGPAVGGRRKIADGEEGSVGRERADRLGDVVGAGARRPAAADGACASLGFRVCKLSPTAQI